MLKSFYTSPALRVAAAFAFGGAAFSIGNLILARALPTNEYGLVSLIVGLVSLAMGVGPLGIDLVITRRGLRLGSHLRRAALLASVAIAIVTTASGAVLYHLQLPLLVCLFVATTSGGISLAAAAHFQSQGRFGVSVPIQQSPNWALIPVGIFTAIAGASTALVPSAILAVSGAIAAAIGWILVTRKQENLDPPVRASGLWSESISLMSVTLGGAIFLQLERLVIPATVGIKELAIFGVLAALVGSPFRIVQSAVNYSVIPALRDARTVDERRQLLRRECFVIAAALSLASVGIWMLAPRLANWLLAGRYDLTDSLMLATLISGVLKVLSAFGTSVASAIAPENALRVLSVATTVCIGIAVAASFVAARWGLVGVLYAISFGWLIRCVVASWISLPHLRRRSGAATSN